jgi:hypothetical protein
MTPYIVRQLGSALCGLLHFLKSLQWASQASFHRLFSFWESRVFCFLSLSLSLSFFSILMSLCLKNKFLYNQNCFVFTFKLFMYFRTEQRISLTLHNCFHLYKETSVNYKLIKLYQFSKFCICSSHATGNYSENCRA